MTFSQARIFLERLARSSSVSGAIKAANTTSAVVYHRRQTDKNFAAAWADALERGFDRLEDVATARAVDGWDEGVWHKGDLVGWNRKYSDTLLMFKMKGARPAKYAHFDIGQAGDEGKAPIEKGADVVALIEQKLAGLARRSVAPRLENGADQGDDF